MAINSIDCLIQQHPNRVVVQPRMGFSCRREMRSGLKVTRASGAPVVGTITVDAMTRQGLVDAASEALRRRETLNGYPIASYSTEENQALLAGVRSEAFPVQVRHGSPLPMHVFRAAASAGIDSNEGGPLSYCLPYSRIPVEQAIAAWRDAIQFWAVDAPQLSGRQSHCESFGGCMMGQLCPPSMLVALSILEGRFFADLGLQSLSVSYAQGTNDAQDIGASRALRDLAEKYLGAALQWHVVQYTWMGVFPSTRIGALELIRNSARIAARGGADRLIVKTVAEAHGIPTVEDNRVALTLSRIEADTERDAVSGLGKASAFDQSTLSAAEGWRGEIAAEAAAIVDAVLSLDQDVGTALAKAMRRGWLDVPFCLHQDNANQARGWLDPATGALHWQAIGRLPLPSAHQVKSPTAMLTSDGLLKALSYNRARYDSRATLRDCAMA